MKVIEYICCIENTDPYTLELQTAGLMWYVKKQRYTVVETQIDSIPTFDFRRDNLNIILYRESNPCDTVLVFDKNLRLVQCSFQLMMEKRMISFSLSSHS